MALTTDTNNQQEINGDCYLDLKRLSKRSCMSVRGLRDDLKDPEHPLPCFRKGGKIYVRWTEFATWMENFRPEAEDLGKKVDDMVNGLVGDV
jgi:hypothetical protein